MPATRTTTIRCLVTSLLAVSPFVFATSSFAADTAPDTAEVLGKVHETNQKEIAAGKVAEKKSKSKEVVNFAKMLVKDHSDADKKVMGMAKKEKLDLAGTTSAAKTEVMAEGPDFDRRFTQEMLDDHKKDIADLTAARDKTTDPKLKEFLTKLLPTLQKHQDTAQKILDGMKK